MQTNLRTLYDVLSASGTEVPILPGQRVDGTRETTRVGQVNLTYRKPTHGREVLIIRGVSDPDLRVRVCFSPTNNNFLIDQPVYEARGVSRQDQAQTIEILCNMCAPYLPVPEPAPKRAIASIKTALF
ncbi:hypothetical protein HN592_01115 [Candidatus Woesearchaeota archaeon]|jgi:hypothetical protein|nr:hypothetical protein [Candidatus Woesearchaeota archaeon]MBT4368905.1 hypothetical protein [Candidatus Woesearchaeota archaeon]MBT4712194.1 hypothetical protein [Candidatus Woesearchaeota archaeon]MBT6639058.1 hypothetical protein [Candidatus Woesearchaeota archaeon]MBT7134258.1 hypothetical protein [Candidatus Woesearchaeota archaeon]